MNESPKDIHSGSENSSEPQWVEGKLSSVQFNAYLKDIASFDFRFFGS